MAAKQLVFSEEARRKLKNGMNVVANAVSATLGPNRARRSFREHGRATAQRSRPEDQ